MNSIIFGGLAVLSLFVFFNLGKIKASKKQTNRNNTINRFGNQPSKKNIIEGQSKEVDEDEKHDT